MYRASVRLTHNQKEDIGGNDHTKVRNHFKTFSITPKASANIRGFSRINIYYVL